MYARQSCRWWVREIGHIRGHSLWGISKLQGQWRLGLNCLHYSLDPSLKYKMSMYPTVMCILTNKLNGGTNHPLLLLKGLILNRITVWMMYTWICKAHWTRLPQDGWITRQQTVKEEQYMQRPQKTGENHLISQPGEKTSRTGPCSTWATSASHISDLFCAGGLM
jgi:hypothetical protein